MRRPELNRRPRRLGVALAIGAAATAAGAHELEPSIVGLHLVSKHAQASTAPGSLGWNERNWGAYARWPSGVTAGAFRNSLFQDTVYAGWTAETPRWHGWSLAATAMLMTGYDEMTADSRLGTLPGQHRQVVRCDSVSCRQVEVRRVLTPALAPSVSFAISERQAVRLAIMAGPKMPTVAHLMVETRF